MARTPAASVSRSARADLSGTIRRVDTNSAARTGSFYRIADDSNRRTTTPTRRRGRVADHRRWQSTVRFGSTTGPHYINPRPRAAVRSVRIRRQLPRRDGDDDRRERVFGDRPGDPRLWRRRVPVCLFDGLSTRNALSSGQVDLPSAGRMLTVSGRRPLRERRRGFYAVGRRVESEDGRARRNNGGMFRRSARLRPGPSVVSQAAASGYQHNAVYGYRSVSPRVSGCGSIPCRRPRAL